MASEFSNSLPYGKRNFEFFYNIWRINKYEIRILFPYDFEKL